MLWSDALALEGRQSPSDDIEAIQKVTLEDVRDLARRLLDSEQSISAILTPQASGQPISSASFGGTESFASTEQRDRSASWLGAEGESALHPGFDCASASHNTVEWIEVDRAAGDDQRHDQRLRLYSKQF